MRTRSRRSQWIWSAVVLVLITAIGVGLFVFRHPILQASGMEATGAPTTISPSLLQPTSTPSLGSGTGLYPAAEDATVGEAANPEVLQQRLAGLDKSQLTGDQVVTAFQAVDVETGEVLADQAGDQLLIPASNTKLLTVTAVMASFSGNETFKTSVVQPAEGQLVLVGGGDPLLTSEPVAEDTYPKPPSLRELASQTAEELKAAGTTQVTLGYDASLFEGSGWNETWPEKYRDQVTPISALWADEGRDENRARSREPAALAAQTFAKYLTEAGITVSGEVASAEASGDEIAAVESLPVHVLAEVAMQRSNNSFTEVLGVQLAIQEGNEANFPGSVAAIEANLRELGIWVDGAVLRDASGLSRSNQVSSSMLVGAMQQVVTEPRLSVVLDGLPVAGVTGTLADRYADDTSRPARGVAKAKTGTLSGVSTLAGVTRTKDGRDVLFAFMMNGSPAGWYAKIWADQGVGTISGCGC